MAVSMRTNLRQQLMKQQLAEQDKRFQQHQLHAESQVSDAVSMPNCDVSVSTEVPAQILQVSTDVFFISYDSVAQYYQYTGMLWYFFAQCISQYTFDIPVYRAYYIFLFLQFQLVRSELNESFD